MASNSLIWFRSDLRCADNIALSRATADEFDHCFAVFVISHAQWDKHDMGQPKRDFVLAHVQDLQQSLKKRGIPLFVLEVPLYADTPAVLLSLCKQHNISNLFANYEYPVNEIDRDQAVVNGLQGEGISCEFSHDYIVKRPGSVRTQAGDYYKVFTQFKKNWLSQVGDAELQEHKANKKPWPSAVDWKDVEYNYSIQAHDILAHWTIGEAYANQQLQAFIDERGEDYKQQRDIPSKAGTSSLSAYLAIGAVSIRACFRYARFANEGQLSGSKQGIDTWISELIWREFYQHILRGFPHVVKYQPFQEYTRHVDWRSSEQDLQAWKDGKTGIPIVDAAMRQLNQTGWMHNRLRMVAAMFLTKNLLIDWRQGEKYFAEQLVDWEFGANNGGWQWAASTGTDAAPYFRIFNPVSQSQRFDPEGQFIRRYVPELADLNNKQIHEPYSGKASGLFDAELGYPHPIVDLKTSRQAAIEAFKQAKQHYENNH